MSELIKEYRGNVDKHFKSAMGSMDNLRNSMFNLFCETEFILTSLKSELERNNNAPATSAQIEWHTSEEIPSEDGYYIVATNNGAVFVSRPVLGKWMRGIAHWMNIPQLPQ